MASQDSPPNDCPNKRYLSSTSLYFSLYCGVDQPDSTLDPAVIANDVEDCLDQCSQKANGLCAAAVFDDNGSRCYFKNENVTEDGTVSKEGFTFGVANRTQIRSLSDECPDSSASQLTSMTTPDFTIYCHSTTKGFDACPDEAPDCRKHTSTMDECLEHCMNMDSLCTAVDWDSSVSLGYLNCYPKNGTAAELDSGIEPAPENLAIHTAQVLLEDLAVVAPDSCSDAFDSVGSSISAAGGNITAAGRTYDIKCNAYHPGYGIESAHATSIDDCAEQCTRYGDSCLSVVFEASMEHGWRNCALKTKTLIDDDPNFWTRTNYTLASVRVPPSSNKVGAWIAGPIIGGVVLIAAVLGGWWWWARRRRRKNQAAAAAEMDSGGAPQELPATKDRALYELDSATCVQEKDGAERIEKEVPDRSSTEKNSHAPKAVNGSAETPIVKQ